MLTGNVPWLVTISSHFVAQFNDAVLVRFDVRQMEGHISVEFVEEWDSIANQSRHNRITNFVREAKTKAFAGDHTAPNKPDRLKPASQALIHELRKIA